MTRHQYRVWDNTFKRWYKDDYKITFWDDGSYSVAHGLTDDIVDDDNDLVVEQYSGLKDMNDEYIFEGDVIEWYINDFIRTAPVIWVYDQACFWMGEEKENKLLVINDWMRGEYKIIGNIHENPELLA